MGGFFCILDVQRVTGSPDDSEDTVRQGGGNKVVPIFTLGREVYLPYWSYDYIM